MTDLNIPVAADRALSSAQGAPRAQEPIWHIIELLFFAYRDFIGDPDDVLAKLGFGRAHHRVLHFVNRNPGMKVAELLDVLKITKQSLGRVLTQLIATPCCASSRAPTARGGRAAEPRPGCGPWPRRPPLSPTMPPICWWST